MSRRRGLRLLAVLTLLVAPAGARAHSLLLEASPAPGATVASPSSVSLRFNNRVEKRLCRVRVVDDAGRARAAAVSASEGSADRVAAAFPALPPGDYRVEWQVLSTDGHVVSGSYGFHVR